MLFPYSQNFNKNLTWFWQNIFNTPPWLWENNFYAFGKSKSKEGILTKNILPTKFNTTSFIGNMQAQLFLNKNLKFHFSPQHLFGKNE
jgi:hypothetical protein